MAKFDEIVASLPSLSKQQLADLLAIIQSLKKPDELMFGPSERELYDVIMGATKSHQGLDSFAKSNYYKTWKRLAPGAIKGIEDLFPGQTKVVRVSIYKYMVDLLSEDLRVRSVPVAFGSVVRNLGRLPEVLDAAFPGYVQSGLTHIILEAMLKRSKE